jgi:hypothetical protein
VIQTRGLVASGTDDEQRYVGRQIVDRLAVARVSEAVLRSGVGDRRRTVEIHGVPAVQRRTRDALSAHQQRQGDGDVARHRKQRDPIRVQIELFCVRPDVRQRRIDVFSRNVRSVDHGRHAGGGDEL